jgi:hypothetical protein
LLARLFYRRRRDFSAHGSRPKAAGNLRAVSVVGDGPCETKYLEKNENFSASG